MKYLYYLLFISLLFSCDNKNIANQNEKNKIETVHLEGKTMGTTFAISYLDSTNLDLVVPVKECLLAVNYSASTYIKDSEISIFNQNDSLEVSKEGHFMQNYIIARYVYRQTNGWFNPTVMPLVNYWGFGYQSKKRRVNATQRAIDSLLLLVDFDKIKVTETDSSFLLVKQIKGLELDFSAVAKGYAVDEVGRVLEAHGIGNYFVEIGGEIRTRGFTSSGFAWRTGIRKPQQTPTNDLQMILELNDKSLATSGNYENYYEDPKTGAKYAHTINPKTGYPEKNALLSASVFAKDCGLADAFATAFMAMGIEKAFAIAQKNTALEAYFIYADDKGNLQEKMTQGVEEMQLKKD